MLESIKIVWVRYIRNATFHGLRYLAEPGLHWTERTFWFVCSILCWWASASVITSAWNSYQNSAVSFVVNTNYRDWNTQFSAVYVCERNNEDKVAEISDRIFGNPHDCDLDEIIKEMAFYNEDNFFTLRMCGPGATEPDKLCIHSNLGSISPQVRSGCTELIKKCKWNTREFDCCATFVPLDTDLGRCFALNSLQSKANHLVEIDMVSNRTTGPGSLHLTLKGDNLVYVLGRYEVPSVVTSKKDVILVDTGKQIKRRFAVKEIENQPEVKTLNIHQRKCRYPEENYLDVYPYYSYSACLTQCRKDAQINKCGCAHHLMPHTDLSKQCNVTGLDCIQTNFQELMVQKPPGSQKKGLECDCLDSCVDSQLDVITETMTSTSEDYSLVDITLERLPTERFRRNVVKGSLDLIVSIGSALALFLGASFLTAWEILVNFVMRPVSDYFRTTSNSYSWCK